VDNAYRSFSVGTQNEVHRAGGLDFARNLQLSTAAVLSCNKQSMERTNGYVAINSITGAWRRCLRLILLICISSTCAMAQSTIRSTTPAPAQSSVQSTTQSAPQAMDQPASQSMGQPAAAQSSAQASTAQVASAQALPVVNNEAVEAVNRKVLEDRAGKNAAKLMLRSTPDKSTVRIDGKPIGKTPLLIIVPPGVYVVEMEGGDRVGYSRRQIDLLPKETREVALTLQPHYPARVRLSWSSHP
jgi:PEGA domain